MKKLFAILVLILVSNNAYSACETTKCTDIMSKMYDSRATIANVLNLTDDQKKCKETIDEKFQKDSAAKFDKYEQEKYVYNNMKKHSASDSALAKQQKVIDDAKKEILQLNDNYDKEFKSILNSYQKSKLKTIRKMEKKMLNLCKSQKPLYEQDENLKPFGMR